MTRSTKKFNLSLFTFKYVLIVLFFLMGGLFALNDWQPFKFIVESAHATRTLIKEVVRKRPVLVKARSYKTDGVNSYNSSEAYDGLTILQGTLPGGTQLRLIDMQGNEVHRWPIDFFAIWPDPKHLKEIDRPKTEFNYHTQGMVALPDGSVIINIGDKGTAKLNKCGEVEWTVDSRTHHSITPAGNKGYWIPSGRAVDDIPKHLLFSGISREKLNNGSHGDSFHNYENLILFIDTDGKQKHEFSVLQSLYDAGLESHLYDAMLIKASDPTHINDIEVVTKALAEKITNVNPGDLLVSVRQLHMLAIFDQVTGALKWHFVGPWIYQHDPDITEDGNIVVFNNSRPAFSFNRTQGSNLILLDPETQETTVIYPVGEQKGFYSDIMGTHQALKNGNHLITESRAGRVFEVNPQGDIVWDFVQPYDDTHASLIADAQRLDKDFFTVEDWNCN